MNDLFNMAKLYGDKSCEIGICSICDLSSSERILKTE